MIMVSFPFVKWNVFDLLIFCSTLLMEILPSLVVKHNNTFGKGDKLRGGFEIIFFPMDNYCL